MRLKTISRDLGLVFFAVIACLAAAELCLRISNKVPTLTYVGNPLVGVTLEPNKTMRNVSDEFDVIVKTNSLGFNDKEWSVDKGPDAFRIAVLGDSFTAGIQVSFENIFTRRLEHKLNDLKSNKKFEVLNFGMTEMGTAQEYEALRHYALNYHPDLVILAFFMNDVQNDIPQADNYKYKPYYRLDSSGGLEYVPFKVPGGPKDKFRNFMKRHLRLVRFFTERIRRRPALEKFFIKIGLLSDLYTQNTKRYGMPASFCVFEKEYQPVWNDGWAVTLKLIAGMKGLCEEKNIEFLAVNIPYEPLVTDETGKLFKIYPKMKGRDWDFSKPFRSLDNFCRGEDIRYLDLLPLFKDHYKKTKTPLYFEYDQHLNKEGMELTASLIFEEIVRRKPLKLEEGP